MNDFFSLRDRLKADRDPRIPTLVIPAGTCGQASGANDLIRIAKREFLDKVNIKKRSTFSSPDAMGFARWSHPCS